MGCVAKIQPNILGYKNKDTTGGGATTARDTPRSPRRHLYFKDMVISNHLYAIITSYFICEVLIIGITVNLLDGLHHEISLDIHTS